jgi:hypothetical protein
VKRALVAMLAAGLLVGAAPARADVYDDNPAGASRGAGDMYVFARGADGAIYERHLAGGAWTPWASIGGQTSSGPAAVAYAGQIHVFVLGTDNAIWQNVLRAEGWSGWSSLGGYGTSAPAAVARRGTSYLDVAVRGGDNAIWQMTYIPGVGWTNASLGGNLTSAPAVNSQDPHVLNVWARGTDGQLYQRAWNGSAWSDWTPLGGGLLGAPSVLSRAENHIDVFVRGTDRAMHQRWWHGGLGWSAWGQIDPLPLDSTPAAASDEPDHVVLFARQGANIVVKEWRAATGFGQWSDWGPVAPPPPPPPPPPADGSVELSTGFRCTPPGGGLRVRLKIRKRPGRAAPRIRRVVFFVKPGPRRIDRKRPWVRRLVLNRPAGAKGRVYARAYYTRKGSKKVRRKTVSRRFVMCG